MRRRTTSIAAWLGRHGFAAIIGAAAIAAALVALATPVPSEVPSYALQAPAVYRVEVGAAFFAALYLVATATALATHNRAFTELGSSGVSARDLKAGSQDRAVADLEKNLDLIRSMIAEVRRLDDDK